MQVSWSQIKMWRRCHRQWWYRYTRRLRRKSPALPLAIGRMVGECMNAVVEGEPWDAVLVKYQKEFGRMWDEERDYYGDPVATVSSIIKRYQWYYAEDKWTYLKGPHGRKSELKVEVDLGQGVTFMGYIDKLPQDPEGRVWVWDHKAHKTIPGEEQRFSDLQLVLYTWAIDRTDWYDGPSPAGVIWDYVRTKVPTVPEVLKNGELTRRKDLDTDKETYLKALRDNNLDPLNYGEILTRLDGAEGNFFQRVKLPKPSRLMVNQVVEDIKVSAAEIKHLGGKSITRNMGPMCTGCDYFSLCHAELRGLDAEFVVKSEYTVKEKDSGDKETGV